MPYVVISEHKNGEYSMVESRPPSEWTEGVPKNLRFVRTAVWDAYLNHLAEREVFRELLRHAYEKGPTF